MYDQEKIVIFENAVKHRQNIFKITNNRGISIEFDEEVVHIPIGFDEWVCDFCNDPMPVKTKDDEFISMLSLNGSHTLCNTCWLRVLKQDKSLFENISVCACCHIEENIHTFLALLDDKKENWVGWVRFPNKEQADKWGSMRMEVTNEVSLALSKNKTQDD